MAKKWIGYIGVGSLMCAALGCGILYTRQARLQQTISDKVLRFHVLANSDSEADQNLKLAVRDAVGSFMQEKLTAVENLEECEMVVRQSLGEIEEAAAETIAENGYDYDVTAELEHHFVSGKKLWKLHLSGGRLRGTPHCDRRRKRT